MIFVKSSFSHVPTWFIIGHDIKLINSIYGMKFHHFVLCIDRPMLINSPPIHQTVDEWSSTLQLECQFSGTPIPRVTWHTDGGAITGSVASSVNGSNVVIPPVTHLSS